jgi:hypothetical protein
LRSSSTFNNFAFGEPPPLETSTSNFNSNQGGGGFGAQPSSLQMPQ